MSVDRNRWLPALLLGGLLLGLAAVPAISRTESHRGRLILAGVALLLVTIGWLARGRGAAILVTLWSAVAVVGVFNYYQFDSAVLLTVGDHSDATYYYLNSKYFDELGYTRLYEAILVADDEGPQRLRHISRFRDLDDYEKMHSRLYAVRHDEEVRSHFSESRWRSFRHDVDFFTAHRIGGGWTYFFIDHGYNPPPTWTLIGGALSAWVPVERLEWITAIDLLLVSLLMWGIRRTYPAPVFWVALVFFCVTFSGRWPILGQSILRFDWLCALVGAQLCLRRERHGWAGALLAYASLVRIFPVLFALPYLVRLARDTLRARRLSPAHRRFLVGAAICALLLGGGALLRYGPDAYVESAANLALHAGPESFSSHRVGLGDALLYRGELSRSDLRAAGGIEAKRAQLRSLQPWLQLAGLVTLAALAAFVWKRREPVHQLLWLGIFPLFVMTNPQINYYNLRLLLVLWHASQWHRRRHRLGLGLLFAIEIATQAAMVAGAARYGVTAMTSVGLLIYLSIMATLLVRDQLAGDGREVECPSRPVGL